MVKYKSRANIISKQLNPIKAKDIKRNRSNNVKFTGGNLIGLLKKRTPKKIRDFINERPKEALKIAKNLQSGKDVGGSFLGKAAAGIGLVATGVAAGALGFREYLIQNPGEASKLAGTAVSTGLKTFFGGSLPKIIRDPKILRDPKIIGIGVGNGIGTAKGGSIQVGGGLDGKKIVQATKAIQKIVKKKLPEIKMINFKKITHKTMSHILNHATPHEFSLLRGLASNVLNIPHPMDSYIKSHVGGSFALPENLHLEAMKDILRAPSPHFLAEMLHSERLDKEKGMDVGGGLLDSIKHLSRRGLSGAKNLGKNALSVGRSINTFLQKGILISQALEPLINLVDPDLASLLDSALKTAKTIQLGLGSVVSGADSINALLHGDVNSALNNLGQIGLSVKSVEAFGQTAEELKAIVERGKEEKLEGEQARLEELTPVLEPVSRQQGTIIEEEA